MHKKTEANISTVREYARVGIPQVDIAKALGISKNTLVKHYREDMDSAMTSANAKVGGKLYDLCMDGNVTCLIFWAKTRNGWRETADTLPDDVEEISSVTIKRVDASKR